MFALCKYRSPADGDKAVYLVIRVFLCNAGLHVTHEGVNEATAISHGLSGFQFATAQVPKEKHLLVKVK